MSPSDSSAEGSDDVSLLEGEDGLRRCWWCGADPLYIQYHDDQWGLPVADDRRLYEKICLEGFQAGLSWITILRRRQTFRKAFANFDFQQVARFGPRDVQRLMGDPGVIRHRGKIESAINNARCALQTIEECGSLAALVWQFEPEQSPVRRRRADIPSTCKESIALGKELKRRGWSFVGPTTCYAMMQSVGMVNDHLRECHCWAIVDEARSKFTRPSV